MKHVLPVLLLSWLVGCASPVTPATFARELLVPDAPRRPFRTMGEEIHLTQPVIDSLRSQVEAEGDKLLGILQFPQGVHPYLVLVLVEGGDTVDAFATSVYWGMVQAKYRGSTDRREAQSLLSLAAESFSCRSGPATERLFGSVMVHWSEGEQAVCDGGFFSSEGAEVGEHARGILDALSSTFEIGE